MEALEKTIAENQESKSSSSSSPQPDPEIVRKAIDELERIDPKYKSSPEDVAEKSHIAANPSLAEYYQKTEKSFNEAFLAAGLMSTDEFTTQTSNSINALGAFYELSSSLPFVSAVFSTVILAADTVSSAKKSGEFQNISYLNPNSNPTDAGNLSEHLARRLTISNESEINDIFNGVGKEERLDGISGFLAEAKKILIAGSKKQVGKLDEATARGLFGEDVSPVQLLALDNAKSALEYVMHQQPAEIEATKSDINNRQEVVIDRIVENAIGKSALRLVSSIPVPSASSRVNSKPAASTTVKLTSNISQDVVVHDPISEARIRYLEQQIKARDESDKKRQEEDATKEERLRKAEALAKKSEERSKKAEKSASHSEKITKNLISSIPTQDGAQLKSAFVSKDGKTTLVAITDPQTENRIFSNSQTNEDQAEKIQAMEDELEELKNSFSKSKNGKGGGCCVIS